MIRDMAIIFLSVLLYGALHSWLASLGLKSWLSARIGEKAMRSYRLFYNLFAFVSLLPVLALVGLLPDCPLYAIPSPWLVFTLILQLLAGLALLLGLFQTDLFAFIGLRQLVQPPSTAQPRLVVSGLYRWVRHPLYTAGLALIWLVPVMTANLLALNLGLTVYILLGAWLEERKLLAEFGSAYAEYRARTPMLIPGWVLFSISPKL
jgi:protein-S-isoprenylcysteine O-methyltransferase Ste14